MAAKKFAMMMAGIDTLTASQLLEIIAASTTKLQTLHQEMPVKPKAKPKAKAAASDEEKAQRAQPEHLAYNSKWTDYVLEHARQHGWPSFEKKIPKRGHESTIKQMSASEECDDGSFVFADTKDAFPTGDAKYLAKHYKDTNNSLRLAYEKSHPVPVTKPKEEKPKEEKPKVEKPKAEKLKAEKPKVETPKTEKKSVRKVVAVSDDEDD